MTTRLFPIITLLIICVTLPCAAIDRTTRKKLKATTEATATTDTERQDCDTTLVDNSGDIRLSGYDKPLRSRRESLFVTNRTPHTITSLTLEIEYSDTRGRQLHKTVRAVKCHIPASETRRIDFPSWDIQQSFYYELSGKPQRADGTPYRVSCRTVGYTTPHYNK